MPDEKTIKLYNSLGGELITIGSDAHRPEDVGADIKTGMKIAKDAGFNHFNWYKNRKAQCCEIKELLEYE